MLVLALVCFSAVHAAESVTSLLSRALAEQYPGARIELTSAPIWTAPEQSLETADAVRFQSDNGRGEAQFIALGEGIQLPVSVQFRAIAQAYFPNRRILPGQALTANDLSLRDLDVSIGMGREYRGLLLSQSVPLAKLQARQTLLENQFIVASAVEKIPDVRRGEAVQVKMISGEVTLTTAGQVEEPGYLNDSVRVLVGKTKKEVIGKLTEIGQVEVDL